MTVDLRYAHFGDYPRIRNFLNEFWQPDHVYVRQPELFHWTFGRTELWDHDGYSFALMEDRDDLVGILGAIPFNFNCFGRGIRAVWFANYMIRSEYRRGGSAIRLLGAFPRPPYDVKIVFGMNSRVAPIYQRMGWKFLTGMARHFFVVPGATARASHLFQLAHPNWSVDRANRLAESFCLPEMRAASVDYNCALPLDWNTHDWPQIAPATIGAARDANYLTWRYLHHPSFDYRFLAVPEGRRTGLAVWRLETICLPTANGRENLDTIGRLVEFLPASHNNARMLFSVFCKEVLASGAFGADFYGCRGDHRAWFEEFGFRLVDNDSDGEAIPSRFKPLDSRSGKILGAVCYSDDVTVSPGDPRWYWTKSDADQDRPN